MAESVDVDREAYSVRETSKKLGLGLTPTWNAVRRGDIASVRIGRRVLVPRAAIERLLAGNVPKPPAHTGGASAA